MVNEVPKPEITEDAAEEELAQLVDAPPVVETPAEAAEAPPAPAPAATAEEAAPKPAKKESRRRYS